MRQSSCVAYFLSPSYKPLLWLTSSPVVARVVSRAGHGLKFVKMFQADFGPACKLFYNIQSKDFLLS